MAGRGAFVTIAGVALVDEGGRNVRCELVDAEGLKSTRAISHVQALDFSVQSQISNRAALGIHFGVRVPQIPISVLNSVVAAINTAVNALNTFPVVAADEFSSPALMDNVSAQCMPDTSQMGDKLFTHGPLSNKYVKDVTFRLITK
jgi:hypothetical protein